MRPLIISIFFFTRVAVFTANGGADADVRHRYQEYAEAVTAMQADKYMALFSEKFSMKSPDGQTHDRAEMMRYQQTNAATTKKVYSYTAQIQAISPLGNGDIAVIVLQKYDRDQAPADAPDKPHRIQTSVVQRGTWHREAGQWKISSIEEILSGPVLMDGKPLSQ
jgi:hypothetical protein